MRRSDCFPPAYAGACGSGAAYTDQPTAHSRLTAANCDAIANGHRAGPDAHTRPCHRVNWQVSPAAGRRSLPG